MFSTNTDDKGDVSSELSEGLYEAKVEKYGLIKVFELMQDDKVLFVEPKKHWWQ